MARHPMLLTALRCFCQMARLQQMMDRSFKTFTWEGGAMDRRQFLKLSIIMGGTIVLGGTHRFGGSLAGAAGMAIPTVDQLIMTNVVDNIYDVFAKRGKIRDVIVERAAPQPMPLSEHGLAYHLASIRGNERREILLDFAW